MKITLRTEPEKPAFYALTVSQDGCILSKTAKIENATVFDMDTFTKASAWYQRYNLAKRQNYIVSFEG